MSYQVIARKWRPQTFEEVTGQEPITRTLRNAIEHERLHHAYLFSGARGVGKTTTARLLAKALNCHKAQKPTPTPCRTDDVDICPSCREISESRSIDVQEIDAASNTGVDNVRDAIIGSVGIAPARDRYKVFIIDEVHMLSTAAFNALLKTLEEPPPRVVFIMATTEHHKVPETITSRSQQFEFRTIGTAKIHERLRLIADAEKIKIPEDALREIARAGDGSMRDAQSAFDQVISFSGDEIKKEDVEMALGVAGADVLIRIMNGIAANQPAEALAVVDDLVMRGHDLRNFCRDLLAHFRDLLVAKVSGSNEMLESAVCDRRDLDRQAALFSESDLVRFFHSLADTETKLRTATHPRYQLEVGLVKLMEMRRLQPISELVARIAALEESIRTGTPIVTPQSSASFTGNSPSKITRPATTRSAEAIASSVSSAGAAVKLAIDPAPQAASVAKADIPEMVSADVAVTEQAARLSVSATKGATEISADAIDQGSEIERLKSALEKMRKRFLITAIEGARVARLEESELYLEFLPDNRHLRDALAKPENVKIIREACQELIGKEMGVRILVKDNEADETQPLSKEAEERLEKQQLLTLAEQSPVVQQMLSKFRGEIVEVRRVNES